MNKTAYLLIVVAVFSSHIYIKPTISRIKAIIACMEKFNFKTHTL